MRDPNHENRGGNSADETLERDPPSDTSPDAPRESLLDLEIGDDSVVNTPADDAGPDIDADLDPDDAP